MYGELHDHIVKPPTIIFLDFEFPPRFVANDPSTKDAFDIKVGLVFDVVAVMAAAQRASDVFIQG